MRSEIVKDERGRMRDMAGKEREMIALHGGTGLQVLDGEVPAVLGMGDDAWALVAGKIGLGQLAPRRGSTEELSVLLAQYALLARRQAALREVMKVRPVAGGAPGVVHETC
jgi:8-oxo-dGTP pyrophosphatase MutT (NUDIX family)